MNDLYAQLEETGGLGDRRKIIAEFLRATPITADLPRGSALTAEESIPSEDHRTSFPFVVGRKYLRDEPYCAEACPVYVLGVVRSPDEATLLVIESDAEGVGRLPRHWMLPPEVMFNQKGFFN